MKVTVHSEDFFTLPRYSTSASILTHGARPPRYSGEVSIPFYLDVTLCCSLLSFPSISEKPQTAVRAARECMWIGVV